MAELLDCLFSSDLGKLTAIFEKINVNCVIPGTDGCTPLHVVAGMENSGNKDNLITFLLDKGANPNARSFEKLTPVHIASMWNNCYQLEKLLQNGGNPWLTDCENKNSFDMAADNYAYEASQLLHTYLHEGKLNFKNERKLFPPCNKAMVSFEFAQRKNEYSRTFSNTMFMTANENFSLLSLDNSDESDFDFCKNIEKNHSLKYNQNEQDEKDCNEKSVWNISNCVKRNCSKHNQNKHAENLSSDESVRIINTYINGKSSSKHNQIIRTERDNNRKSVSSITSKCIERNSSKHNENKQHAANVSSDESVRLISEYINDKSSSKHNQIIEAEKGNNRESVSSTASKCIERNCSNHNQNKQHAENVSSDESVRIISKYINDKSSSKHNQIIEAEKGNNRESVSSTASKCIERNCSKHNQNKQHAENVSSDESVRIISKYINDKSSSKHNQIIQAEKGNNRECVSSTTSKCIKENHSSKYDQAENDSCEEILYNSKCSKEHCSVCNQNNQLENGSSEESVLSISKCIKKKHLSMYNQNSQGETNSKGESVLYISKCIKGNNSKHNLAKTDSSRENALTLSKYLKKKHSSKHKQNNLDENDSSEESDLYISKCMKGNCSTHKNNQVENDSSGESVLSIRKCIKGNHSSKHIQNKQNATNSSRYGVLYLGQCIKGNGLKHNLVENDSSRRNVLALSKLKEKKLLKYNQAKNDSSEKEVLHISKCIKRNCSKHNKNNQDENDSSEEDIFNVSKCIEEKCSLKDNQTKEGVNSKSSSTPIFKPKLNSTYKLSPRSVTKQSNSSTKFHENNLNHTCLLSSSESESSDIAPYFLKYSDDNSNYETVIESDDKSEIVLVEVKGNVDTVYLSDTSVCSVASGWKSFQNVDDNCSTLSCSSHSKASVIIPESLLVYSNSRIYEELVNLGDNPGPVLDHTRYVYLLRLARLKTGCKVSCELPKPKYCTEIYQFIENKLDMIRARTLEQLMAAEFEADSNTKWREGNQRCCFNYFLLDPRVTQNLPSRMAYLTNKETFLIFLDSLFYVGKGTRGRPYSHLFEAAKLMESERWKSAKISHIIEIWKAGLGVISLHCFHNSIPVEAYTREACILEAVGKYTVDPVADLGMANLTNIRKGDFYGSSAKLTASRKRLIGVSLLERALQIFLLEGERQIRPKDVKNN